MAHLMIEIDRFEPTAGFMSYADDFMINTQQADANATWNKTVAALKESGLEDS